MFRNGPDWTRLCGWLIVTRVLLGGPTSTARAEIPSFDDDVIPVLTRFQCNTGGCHGKLAGQNGFKLSLRGYASDQDHEAITREAFGRRVNPAAPQLSLLLRKAMNATPHGGGQRIAPDSPAAKLLTDWIQAGIPGPRAEEPKLVGLKLAPSQETLEIGQVVSLKVTATYDDGRQRDVTWLTQFASRDSAMLELTEAGEVKALRHGETVVTAAFRGFVEVAAFTVQYETPVEPTWYSARNNAVDEAVFDKLSHLRLEPSPLCDDATFLRRATLDLLGVLPTPEEVRAFLTDQRSDKRQQLVDALLDPLAGRSAAESQRAGSRCPRHQRGASFSRVAAVSTVGWPQLERDRVRRTDRSRIDPRSTGGRLLHRHRRRARGSRIRSRRFGGPSVSWHAYRLRSVPQSSAGEVDPG